MSGVLVVLERNPAQRNGALSRMSLEALAAGNALAAKLDNDCTAAVLSATGGISGGGKATKLYSIEHSLLEHYTSDGYCAALEQLIKKLNPTYVTFPHTYQVRDFAPALATRFGQVLISDVIAIHDGADAGPVFVRQLLQGKLNADYKHTDPNNSKAPCFVSVQAGSFRADGATSTEAPIEKFTPELQPSQLRSKPGEPFRESAQTVDLSAAPVIVSVGRGIGEESNIPLVKELADALGAELAASRPICDNGWLPMERQVGSSGQTVSPKLYLAVGISGAIQHLVGMKGSRSVIAINKDENAPIFEVADFCVVGDLFEIVPELTKAIRAAKQ
jgi:electron transfer flavoprotein alpha subunit